MNDKFISLHELEGGRLNLSDMDYCMKFAEPKELAELRKKIGLRRAKIPGYSYWQCLNPRCRWAAKMHGETKEPVTCLKCNIQNFKDGSFMVRMSKTEAAVFDKTEDEKFKREVEQLAKMQFNWANESRRQNGLDPVTREEWEKGQRAEYQLEVDRRHSLELNHKKRIELEQQRQHELEARVDLPMEKK